VDITFYLFFIAFLVSLSAWCVFLWAVRTGQFRDIEETKYQIWPKEPRECGDRPSAGSLAPP
jgi:cbb3-type cytochrome oxidase maturation protein